DPARAPGKVVVQLRAGPVQQRVVAALPAIARQEPAISRKLDRMQAGVAGCDGQGADRAVDVTVVDGHRRAPLGAFLGAFIGMLWRRRRARWRRATGG